MNGDFAADRILRKLDLITIVRHDDFGIVNCNHAAGGSKTKVRRLGRAILGIAFPYGIPDQISGFSQL